MRKITVKIIETREKTVDVLIQYEQCESVAIQKVEKMYEDKEFELDEESIEETIYLEE